MAENVRIVREVVGDNMCILSCEGQEFVFLKSSLGRESSFFEKELENLPERTKIILDWNRPNVVRIFEKFVSEKKTLPFENVQEFEDALDFSFQYDTRDFYNRICKTNLRQYLNADTILTFVTIGYERMKAFYTKDLFHVIRDRLRAYGVIFNRVMVENSDAKQLKYYLSNFKPLESHLNMTMILDWVNTSPTVRAVSVPELIDVVHLSKLDLSKIKFFFLELIRYVNKYHLWTAIVNRMMVEQTSVFVMYQNAVDTYRLNDDGRVRRDVNGDFSIKGETKAVFRYLDTMYFITSIDVPNSRKEIVIGKWRVPEPLQWTHTIALVHKLHKVYVSAIGPLVFVAVVDPPLRQNTDRYEAHIVKLELDRPRGSKTVERLVTPFLINEIKCCRTFVYFLSYNDDSKLYDGILRTELSLTSQFLMPLDAYRQPDRKWECSAICKDRLYIFGFNLIESDAASNTPDRPFRMVSYFDDPNRNPGEWSVTEVEVPWRKFNKILNFYDKYQRDDAIEKYSYRFVNFLADNRFMYQYNPETRKFKCHAHTMDPEIPKENVIVTLLRKGR